MRDKFGRFIKGQHYSSGTEFGKKEKHFKWKGGGGYLYCKNCKNKFYVSNSYDKKERKFCSKKCVTKYTWKSGKLNKGLLTPHGKSNETNPNWKGDLVSYVGLHMWLKRKKKRSEFCEYCGKFCLTEFSNISQKYKRDINDFWSLCKKCHASYDNGKISYTKFNGNSNK